MKTTNDIEMTTKGQQQDHPIQKLNEVIKTKIGRKKKRDVIMKTDVGKTKAESKLEAKVTELLKLRQKKIDYIQYLEENYKGQPGYIRYFREILGSRSLSRSLNIGKMLLSKPINFFLNTKVFNISNFTNDLFGNIHMFFSNYPNTQNAYVTYLTPISDLVSIQMASPNLLITTKDIKVVEFYSTDLTPNFSAPFLKNPVVINSIQQVNSKIDLYQKSVYTYNVTPNVGPVFQCYSTEDSLKKEDIAKSLDKYAAIKEEKGVLANGIKEVDRGTGNYYIQQTLRLTDCCSHSMLTDAEFMVEMLAEFSIDYESLLKNAWTKPTILINLGTLITWDTLPAFLEFCLVFNFVYGKTTPFSAKDLTFYQENKNIFQFYKNYYKVFEKCLLLFFDSFTNRIPIDRLQKVKKNITEFYNYQSALQGNQAKLAGMSLLVRKLKSPYVSNFQDILHKSYIDPLNKFINLVLNPDPNSVAAIENLTSEARTLGYMIKDLMYDGSTPIFQVIRSPGSFLTNLIGDFSIERLQNRIESLLDAVAKADSIKKETQAQIEEITKTAKETANQALLNQFASLETLDGVTAILKHQSETIGQTDIASEAFQKLLDKNKQELDTLHAKNAELERQLHESRAQTLTQASNLNLLTSNLNTTNQLNQTRIDQLNKAIKEKDNQLDKIKQSNEQLESQLITSQANNQALESKINYEQQQNELIKTSAQATINTLQKTIEEQIATESQLKQENDLIRSENINLKNTLTAITLNLNAGASPSKDLFISIDKLRAPTRAKIGSRTKFDGIIFDVNTLANATQYGLKPLPNLNLKSTGASWHDGTAKLNLNSILQSVNGQMGDFYDLSTFIPVNDPGFYVDTKDNSPYNFSPLTYYNPNLNWYIPDKWGIPFIPALGWAYLFNSPYLNPKQKALLVWRIRDIDSYLTAKNLEFTVLNFIRQNQQEMEEAFKVLPRGLFIELVKLGQLLTEEDVTGDIDPRPKRVVNFPASVDYVPEIKELLPKFKVHYIAPIENNQPEADDKNQFAVRHEEELE